MINRHMLNRRDVVASGLALGLLPGALRADDRPAWKTSEPRLREAIVAIAGSGGTIKLPGGNYGTLHINIGFPAASPLTIVAADPANPPIFSELDIYGADNVVLDGLSFKYDFVAGHVPYQNVFRAWNSQGIAIRNCLFEGDVARNVSPADDGFPTGFGFVFRSTKNVALEACEIWGFLRGAVISQTTDLRVVNNHIHGMRSDGMDFAEVGNALIENNRFHNFRLSKESGDHLDMIQFWTAGTANPSRNVTIRNNLLYVGNENPTQSIFMRNELVDSGQAGSEMFYQNLLIENNLILNAHLHGITVGETQGLEIINNTLVRDQVASGPNLSDALYPPRINVKSTSRDVSILRNVAAAITGEEGQSDWRVADNLLVQDVGRLRPNFYETVFVGGNWSDPAAYAPRPGGPLDGTGIGAEPR